MKGFGKLFVASLKEFGRDRTSLSFTIILPLLLVAFFGFAYAGTTGRMSVGVVYVGAGARNFTVARALRSDPNVKLEQGSNSTEMSRLHNGSVDAVTVITQSVSRPVRVYYDRGNGTVALAGAALAAELQGHTLPNSKSSPTVITAVGGLANSRLAFVIPGILATAIMWLGIFAAIPLVQQREQQVLRRFAVTPLSRSRLVAAQVLSRLSVSLAQAVLVLAGARLLFGVPIGSQFGSALTSIVVVAALVLLGAAGFVAIGYAVAALSSTQSSAHAWAQLLTMPMLVLAGVFFPVFLMPAVLYPVSALLPLTYLADALRQTTLSGQQFVPLGVDVAALTAWVVVPLAIAVRYFRWS